MKIFAILFGKPKSVTNFIIELLQTIGIVAVLCIIPVLVVAFGMLIHYYNF